MHLSQQAFSHHSLALSQPHLWSFFVIIFASQYFPDIFNPTALTSYSVSSLPIAPSTQHLVTRGHLSLVWQLVSLRPLRRELGPDHQTKFYMCFLTEPSAKEIISPKWEVIQGEHSSLSIILLDISESKSNNKSSFAEKKK